MTLRFSWCNSRPVAESRPSGIGVLSTFLGVALWGAGEEGAPDEPPSLQELAKRILLPASTVSQHLIYLGELGSSLSEWGTGMLD